MIENNRLFPYINRLPNDFSHMLFCFHHAGGSAAVYFPFIRTVDEVAIVPIELPGHGTRRKESQQLRWTPLIKNIADGICEAERAYQKRISLIGCSLGAIIAFECAAELSARKKRIDELIICSHSSPDLTAPGYKPYMGKNALIREIELLSGTASEIMADEDVRDFFLPVIYKDYVLHENYIYDGKVLDGVSMRIIAGRDDPYFNRSNMTNWNNMTTGECSYNELEGGHFCIYEKKHFNIVADKIAESYRMIKSATAV